MIETPDRTGLVAGDVAYVAPNYEEGRPMAQSLLRSNRAPERSRHRLRTPEALYGHDLDQLRAIDDTWP